MKAVNLTPSDTRGRRGPVTVSYGPGYLLIGLLAIAVLFSAVVVLTDNTISNRRAKLTALKAQVATETQEAARLSIYSQFEQTAQQRAQTVRTLASGRFDWHAVLAALTKVVPGDTSLETLDGTLTPSTSGTTTSSTSTGTGPTFTLTGCTADQDDVARLISRLRLINGVNNVALTTSAKSTGESATGKALLRGKNVGAGCPVGWPNFNLTIAFNAPSATTGASG